MKPLTDKQAALLLFCAEFFAENDQLPPYYVSADHFGWSSVNAAVEMMNALRHKGYIQRNLMGKFKFTPQGRAFITERATLARWHPTSGTDEPIDGSVYASSAA